MITLRPYIGSLYRISLNVCLMSGLCNTYSLDVAAVAAISSTIIARTTELRNAVGAENLRCS